MALTMIQWAGTLTGAEAAEYLKSTSSIEEGYANYLSEVSQKGDIAVIMEGTPGFKYGCDPELFVKNAEGKYVSAEGLIPGTKAEPYKVKGGAVQVDGMAAEFNIDPVSSFQEFNANIQAVMGQLQAMLPKGFTLDPVPAVVFDEDVWEGSPDKAKELGCMPDFNAWTGDVNPPPADPSNPRLRTASGHIHIGWTEDADLMDIQHIMNCRDLVKQLDWYLGAWSIRIDTDPTRRSLYGRAGACRYKTYGVEYRVLSNFWITTRDRRLVVWNRMQQAISDMRRSVLAESANNVSIDALLTSINTTTKNSYIEKTYRYPVATLDRSFARI